MITRRRILEVSLFVGIAASTARAADSPVKLHAPQILGTWKVSAVPNSSAGTDSATLSKAPGADVLLTLEGELKKALGGPVNLRPNGEGGYVGTSPSGVEARLNPIDGRRLDLTLRGKGLYFSVYLLK